MNRNYLAILGVAAAIVLAGASATSAQDSFFEDFSTHDYFGSGTADWDTTSGTLRITPFSPGLLGAYDTLGDARGVAVTGDIVCVADGANGLLVFDVTDPAAPFISGTYNTSGIAQRVAIDGNLAFVADSAGGLVVVDISNPLLPTLAGAYVTAGVAVGVAVAGDYAYVADGLAGLAVVDISNPAVPALAGSYNTASYANDVVVAKDVAYVADGMGGLVAINVAQPTAPALLGSYDTAGYATNLAVAGALVYVADGNNGLLAIDVTDPAAPLPAGSFGTFPALDVAVEGDIVCAAAGATGLVQVDFTDPAAPLLIGTYDSLGYGWGVAMDGECAFLGNSAAGLATVEVQVPVAPKFRNVVTTGPVVDIAVAGDWAVAATSSPYSLVFLDVSNPLNMVERDSRALPSAPKALAMDGTRVMVAGGSAGLIWIDPTISSMLTAYDTPGYAVDVAAAGGLAFVADSNGGLIVIDVTNTGLVGQYESAIDIVGVAVAGNIAYVSRGLAGVAALDITDPAVPTILGFYDTPGTAGRLVVSGDHAYVADGASGLTVLDISNPAVIGLAGTLAIGNVVDVDISGNRVFCLLADLGVTIVDVTTPSVPTESSSFSIAGMSSLAISGEHIYVGYSGTSGVIRSYRVSQHDLAVSEAYSYSVQLPFSNEPVLKVRLTANQTGTVAWKVATTYSNWTTVNQWDDWTVVSGWDYRVKWQADLSWNTTGVPSVDDVLIEVLHDHPDIMSVTDIGSDQGRQVSLEWGRSAYDFYGETNQIVEYAVYRRIDGPEKMDALASAANLEGLSPAGRDHAEKMQGAGWHFLTTVPVRTDDRYAVVVPTLVDSTLVAGQHYSTFMVSALIATPGQFFDSPPDSGYSLDNLAPGVPAGVSAAYSANSVILDWADAPEFDFQYYRVYRSTDPAFVPGPGNLVQETVASGWTDPAAMSWSHYYKVTALDFAGNEGQAGSPVNVSGIQDSGVPAGNALVGAVPNPFNPSTRLFFEMAAAGYVRLKVYDTAGRLVTTLVDAQRNAGRHFVTWDGRDSTGRMSAAGVYLYRLEVADFVATKRIVLIK